MSLETRIDRILFHSKHWQLFIVFIGGAFVADIFLEVPAVALFLMVIYVPVLGVRLKKFLPASYNAAFRNFVIASSVLAVLAVFFEGNRPQEPNAIVFILMGVALVCYVMIVFFVARAIKSLETHDRATVNDYFVDILWIVTFFPLGLWFLQPRLNLLGDQFFRD